MSSYADNPVPTIERGEGCYIWDTNGKRYLDALSGLFVVQAGHGREELAQAAAAQARKLAFFPIWSYAHPTAIELADRLAAAAPGDLNKVFFSSGGGESVETAWKVAKQFFKLTGKPTKYKVISRAIAYHGTTQGALSITGVPLVQAAVRAAGARVGAGAEHQLLPGAGVRRTRREGLRPLGRRPDRRGDPDGGRRTPWPPSSSSRSRTPAAASRRRPATSSGCGRSATTTTCCWSRTR